MPTIPMTMTEQRRFLLLIAMMVGMTLLVAGVSIALLYHAALDQQRDRLHEIARSQAALMEALAQFDARNNIDNDADGNTFSESFSQISKAHEQFGSSETPTELTIGILEGDQIAFLLRHRRRHIPDIIRVPIQSHLGEPMRRALRGESGVAVATDYRGKEVLAAYEPLHTLGLGLVAKLDMADLRAPYQRAGWFTLAAALLLSLCGARLFWRFGSPLLRKIEASERKLRRIFDTASDARTLMRDGKIIDCNPAALEMFGMSDRSEFFMLQPAELSPPTQPDGTDSVTAAERYIQQTFRDGQCVFEWVHRRADGTDFPSEVRLTAFDLDGQPIIQGAFTDITERKRVARLREDQRVLEETVNAMEKVLGVISHELRTPLAAVRAMAEVLMVDCDTDPKTVRNFITNIHGQSINMATMVDSILETARLNSGCSQWDWKPFKLSACCRRAVDTVRPLVDPSRIALSWDVQLPNAVMIGDANAVQRILVNLLSNAARHTRDGSITLHVDAIDGEDGRLIRFRIADTGCGIPPEALEKLGQAFALNRGFLGEDNAGAGLGLSLCRSIAAAHGGELAVASRLDEGTTFTVTLRADLDGPVTTHAATINPIQAA